MPTDHDRGLWAKAQQSPNEMTEEEKLMALRSLDISRAANTLKALGLTLDELQTKALTDPKSMTLMECDFIQHVY